jgi:pullulanase
MMAQADDRFGRAVGAHYRIDSFRFDLMGHQPRAMMEAAARRGCAAGRHVPLIGEGWNFGEVANGARFVQASQLSLNGSGIATFSDRARDALRGGGCCDSGEDLVARRAAQRPAYAPNASCTRQGRRAATCCMPPTWRASAWPAPARLPHATPRRRRALSADRLQGQPAGYASQPGEVVNYVENHDNQTLFDINALKLPRDHLARGPRAGAVAGRRLRRLQPGRRLFPRRHGRAAQQVAGPQQLRFRRLVQPPRLDLHRQRLRRRPAAGSDNGKDWALLRPVLREPECDQAVAGGHRLDARCLPRPAAHPRQHAAVPPAQRADDVQRG